MAEVLEDVLERVRDLAACREDVGVVPVHEYLPAAACSAVDRACQPDRQALHAARDAFGAVCLDEQVQVISLNGEVDDADAEALLSFADGVTDGVEQLPSSQVSDVRQRSQRHVDGVTRGEAFPHEMGDAGLCAVGLTPCMPALTAPSWQCE